MLNYHMLDRSCKNILIRGVNWIGDAVMTMPALKALRKELPDAQISLLVKPWVAPIFQNNPDIDEIILYEEQHKGFLGRIKLINSLREKRFCAAILFQNSFDAALIAFLAGISQRIGYKRYCRGFLLTHPITYKNEDRTSHHTDYYLNILRKAGINAEYSKPYIFLSVEERLNARNTLKNLKRPVVGINPGASYGSSKRWLPDRFAEVSSRIINELNGSVVIFGGKKETQIADEITAKLPATDTQSQFLLLAGKTRLRELAGLISECDVFLSNDSGPMHMAYAVRTPLVAIFGSTDPELTGPPQNKSNIVIKKDVECSPCFKRQCSRKAMICMDEIKSDEIFDAIRSLVPANKAVFFDRDGTLCKDVNYLNKMEDLEIFEDIEDLKKLKAKGFMLIGVSNQSGIARGIVDKSFAKQVHDIFIERYGFDDFYFCPHHPDENCSCRKPEPDMLFKARAEYKIDLKKSYVIGDKEIDVLLAKSVGAKGILVLTGQGTESSTADHIASDLKDAVRWIISDR